MARTRLDWIDAARGLALSLVVLFHASIFAHDEGMVPNGALGDANAVFDAFRMPTLVMISGLLAAGASRWSWPELFRRRLGPLALLYAIWTVLGAAFLALTVNWGSWEACLRVAELMVLAPSAATWYLYALVVYFVLGRLLRTVPSAVVIPIAIAINLLVVANWPSDFGSWGLLRWAFVGQHWIFFIAAERGARWYWQAARTTNPRRAWLALAAFAAGAAVCMWANIIQEAIPLLVLCVGGTAVALLAMPVWGSGRAMSWARAVGRNSLGVYVVHLSILIAIARLVVPRVPSFTGAAVLVPVAIAAAAIAVSYGITRALERWAPVPLLRPWWDARARPVVPEQDTASVQAQ